MCHKGCWNCLSHMLSWQPVVPWKELCHSQKHWGHVYSCGSWWPWITLPCTHSLTHRVTLSARGRPKTVRSRGAVISDSWCANARTCCSGSGRPHSLGRPFSINSRSGPRFPSASSYQASQVALVVKNPPTVQETAETHVQSLGREDPLQQDMATHSSVLGLENPMDRGTWWATVHRAAKSWTRLKRLITHRRYWAIIVSFECGLRCIAYIISYHLQSSCKTSHRTCSHQSESLGPVLTVLKKN